MTSLAPRFFRWHRWLGYVVALQVLVWIASGVVFAWLPFDGWVKGNDHVAKPRLELPADWAQRLAAGLGDARGVSAVQAVATAQGPAFKLRGPGGDRVVDIDGRALPRPDAAAARRWATALYKGGTAAASVVALPEAPARLGIVREVPARRPVLRVSFDDALGTRIYIDATSGELLAVRNEAWVWYDFLFRLHVMDYLGGTDFNNNLLRLATPLALALVATGGVLLVLALRRTWRRRRQTAR